MILTYLITAFVASILVGIVSVVHDRTYFAVFFFSGTVAIFMFLIVFVGPNEFAWTGDLSGRVADFDTVPVCYRAEPDIVCCGVSGKMTCMIDRGRGP